MTDLERAVLDMLLAGDHPILNVLRVQVDSCRVTAREFTGVGFFTTLEPSRGAPRAPLTMGKVVFGDVAAQIPGLKHDAGFLLFIKDGYIDFLEGYTYDEPWPTKIERFELAYLEGESRDLSPLEASQLR